MTSPGTDDQNTLPAEQIQQEARIAARVMASLRPMISQGQASPHAQFVPQAQFGPQAQFNPPPAIVAVDLNQLAEIVATKVVAALTPLLLPPDNAGEAVPDPS